MDDDQSMEEVGDLFKNTVYWCNFQKSLRRNDCNSLEDDRTPIVFYNTQPAICIEKAVSMKLKEELYHKVCQSTRLPRVVLKPTSQTGQQDQTDQEARKSSDHQSVSGNFGETRRGNVYHGGIPSILHSSVQIQDTNRRETVKKLIQQFENHPNKEIFLLYLNGLRKLTRSAKSRS